MYRVVSAVGIGLILVGGYFLITARAAVPYAEATTIADGVAGFEELQDRFQELAQDKGGVYAFEILGRATLPPNTDLHLLGHTVGDELYQEKGIDGIADCTQDFRNACSHSIVIGALNDFGGEAALGMIRDSCKKAPGGSGAYTMCYHGLGHGVFAFFSYDLAQTVDFCKKTGTEEHRDREYIECVGGAIMELMGGGGHDHDAWQRARAKYLDPTRPLAPCMDAVIPAETKSQCFVYLTPRLWELTHIDLGSPDPELFTEAFSYCDALPHAQQKLRDACYGGFGKEFVVIAGERDVRGVDAFSDATYQTAIDWCVSAGAEDGQRACVAEALSSVFWGGENDPEASFRFCGLVEDFSMKDACYARLATAIGGFTRGDVRSALCARLPEKYATCGGKE